MEFHEAASGARLHANYFRPGGVSKDLPAGLEEKLAEWAEGFPQFIDDVESLLTNNRIWKQRTVDIGVMSAEEALAWGFSGPCLRASGVPWDLRRAQPYEMYDQVAVQRSGRPQWRLLRPLSGSRRRDARVRQDHQAVPGEDAARAR